MMFRQVGKQLLKNGLRKVQQQAARGTGSSQVSRNVHKAALWRSGGTSSSVEKVRTNGGQVRMSSTATNELLSKLREELDYELKSEEPETPSVSPFTIESHNGTSELVLRRAFGKEDIAVVVSVKPDYPDVENEDEMVPMYDFQVTVSKNGDKAPLEFDCQIEQSKVVIHNVAFGVDTGDYTPYAPAFGELDEGLQTLFYSYLSERGIDDDFAVSIVEAVEAKEQEEYMRWLRDTATFLEQ